LPEVDVEYVDAFLKVIAVSSATRRFFDLRLGRFGVGEVAELLDPLLVLVIEVLERQLFGRGVGSSSSSSMPNIAASARAFGNQSSCSRRERRWGACLGSERASEIVGPTGPRSRSEPGCRRR
jgi:hypothetical protein